MLFSLDVFSEHLSFWYVFGLFMHNIPALILLAALILVWKRELAGPAVVFCLAGRAFSHLSILGHAPASMTLYAKTTVFLGLVVPPTMISLLFFCNWARKKDGNFMISGQDGQRP